MTPRMEEILEFINEMVEDLKDLDGPFYLRAIEALRSLKIKIFS